MDCVKCWERWTAPICDLYAARAAARGPGRSLLAWGPLALNLCTATTAMETSRSVLTFSTSRRPPAEPLPATGAGFCGDAAAAAFCCVRKLERLLPAAAAACATSACGACAARVACAACACAVARHREVLRRCIVGTGLPGLWFFRAPLVALPTCGCLILRGKFSV
eukprot:CAMPEP_0115438720 /NCGR_PEP_ID=MMETSP0271-20121206/35402_1 /TAXON_ID=71861 /ORGANISM="Scrippsiella trochoidea, Strain CCMP3099" /LENGTH=165 /DNA_ID=CAMNT_0002864381 /DNA_START=74 /DNA_END=571 /DNA_ORIENTATION=-